MMQGDRIREFGMPKCLSGNISFKR
jgi:hypothetical protein